MKPLTAIAFASLFALGACSPSDNDDTEPVTTETQYLPIQTGNYWVYKVSGGDIQSGRDSLYVANDTIISGNTYQNLNTKNPAIGFYSASASKNSARKIGNKIVLSGSAGLNFAAALPVNIALTDFVVFKENAANGETLDSKTGSFDQEFNGIPLTVTYTLKTVAAESLSSFVAPDGVSYNNVKPVNTILNLKITTTVGGLAIAILNPQDVVVSKQYYAKDIGVVYTKTTVAYELETFGQPINGIPQNYSQTSEEILDVYIVD